MFDDREVHNELMKEMETQRDRDKQTNKQANKCPRFVSHSYFFQISFYKKSKKYNP